MFRTRTTRTDPAATRQRWWHRLPARLLPRLLRCRLAAIAPMTALLLVPFAGAIAYAVELGSWQYMQRAAQNAADGAALAAATIAASGGTTTAEMEAQAAASKLGFDNGVNNVTVASAVTACPVGIVAPCYEAVVTTSMPFAFANLVGFTGSGGGRQTISARAVATVLGSGGGTSNDTPCLWSVGDSGVTLTGNGIPSANLGGCIVVSEGGILCNGSATMNADYAVAGSGTSSGCAAEDANNLYPGVPGWSAPPPDPYIGLTAPAKPAISPTCDDDADPNNPNEVLLSDDQSGTFLYYCGTVKLTKNINLTGTNTVMVINNGALDLNGFKLKTSGADASTTIVFTGTNEADRRHYPISQTGGTLEIKAPTDGDWANIAIYQDRNLTNKKFGGKDSVDMTYAGNSPTWNIAGVVYFPSSDLIFSGIVGKYEDNVSCFVIISYSILINGNGEIIADNTTPDCVSSGYTIPSVTVPGPLRPKLVV